ncbi:MAG TPA: alanine--tRNA ligase-related protein [Terriglobales bacterium]|nr:alanine--tRNA ligase-related protein [Terriglobales bacterium]
MSRRLYYDQPNLLEFDSVVEDVSAPSGSDARPSFTLRESAFYPTSGGQVHDKGWISIGDRRVRVAEIAETEDGRVVHYLEAPSEAPARGARVHGSIDPDRRRDHMQQHTGQHVLSAAFIELYEFPTVSFHMGDDYCSIDLATPSLTAAQAVGAEKRANEIVFENRPVTIRYVRREEAEKLGLRKLPPAEREELRLIEVANFDLSACGGTHVNATGQIGAILLRKIEKTRQGMRVEFVCGGRAVTTARRDFETLADAASLFSAKLTDVPEMIRKTFEESKEARRQKEEALEQLAGAMAQAELVGSSGDRVIGSSESGRKIVLRVFADRDSAFAKLFAQKLVRAGLGVVALVASTVSPPGIVFAQTAGGSADMGALLKEALAAIGGRGGGSHDFAQGGVPAGCDVEKLLRDVERKLAG